MGTWCKLNIFLNQGFLAANYFSSSIGNVSTVTAKNTKNTIFIIFPKQKMVECSSIFCTVELFP